MTAPHLVDSSRRFPCTQRVEESGEPERHADALAYLQDNAGETLGHGISPKLAWPCEGSSRWTQHRHGKAACGESVVPCCQSIELWARVRLGALASGQFFLHITFHWHCQMVIFAIYGYIVVFLSIDVVLETHCGSFAEMSLDALREAWIRAGVASGT